MTDTKKAFKDWDNSDFDFAHVESLAHKPITAEGIARTMKIQRVHQMIRAINRVKKQAGDTSPKPVLMSKEEFFTKVVKTTDNNSKKKSHFLLLIPSFHTEDITTAKKNSITFLAKFFVVCQICYIFVAELLYIWQYDDSRTDSGLCHQAKETFS